MLTTKQNNLRILAIEHGLQVNDILDCDVIQDAITQLQSLYDDDTPGTDCDPLKVLSALHYLRSAIAFRKKDDVRSKLYLEDFQTTLSDVRTCKRCGDVLDMNDDLICGYHQLED